MKSTLLILLTLFLVAQLPTLAKAPQATFHPAFTLTSRVTMNMNDGSELKLEEVLYMSSGGNFRIVRTKLDGTLYDEKVFERKRGLLSVMRELGLLVKSRSEYPEMSEGPPPTAEQLRSSKNFVRTEEVLGRTTYLLRFKDEATSAPQVDYYFAPELGRVPLKTVTYRLGQAFEVDEPVSLVFGEPAAAQLKAPDYEVDEMMPISGGILNARAVSKPAPVWPQEARQVNGTVTVRILVDEEGKVIKAVAMSGPAQLRPAAVEAAYKTRLSPTRLSGKPVKVMGVLTYINNLAFQLRQRL